MKYQRVLIILLSMVFVVACSKNEKTADGIAEQPLVRDVQLAVVEPQGVEEGFEAVGTVKAKTMG